MFKINIDGKEVEVSEGMTVMDAAVKADIYIPAICYHPMWSPSCWGVDLWHFADNVRNEVTSSTIKNAAQALKSAIDTYVVNEHHSPGKEGSHGVAIYFPPSKTKFDSDPDHTGYVQGNTFYPVQFVDHHAWDEFLKAYYTSAAP